MKKKLVTAGIYLGIAGFLFAIWWSHSHQTVPVSEGLILEVASTPEAMAKGLSGRESLAKDHGMLFKWSDSKIRCMWAKDMKFDLDLGYFDSTGKLVGVDWMKAGTTTPHCSQEAVQAVLEVNHGVLIKGDK